METEININIGDRVKIKDWGIYVKSQKYNNSAIVKKIIVRGDEHTFELGGFCRVDEKLSLIFPSSAIEKFKRKHYKKLINNKAYYLELNADEFFLLLNLLFKTKNVNQKETNTYMKTLDDILNKLDDEYFNK